jgi:hypothetical protein
MSAYLERLAASARNPSSGIAPLMRPLYLPPQAEPEPPGSSLDRLEDEAVPAIRSNPDEPTEQQYPATPPAAPVPPAAFEPLLPGAPPSEVVARAARVEPVAADASTAPADSDMPPPAPAEPRVARPAFAPHPDAPQVQPAQAEQLRAPSAPGTMPVASRGRRVETPVTIRRDAARPLNPLARAERGADEIRIHIGRVEVVAVGPPPAPPERERKALRLDDYLRNGG